MEAGAPNTGAPGGRSPGVRPEPDGQKLRGPEPWAEAGSPGAKASGAGALGAGALGAGASGAGALEAGALERALGAGATRAGASGAELRGPALSVCDDPHTSSRRSEHHWCPKLATLQAHMGPPLKWIAANRIGCLTEECGSVCDDPPSGAHPRITICLTSLRWIAANQNTFSSFCHICVNSFATIHLVEPHAIRWNASNRTTGIFAV